MTRNLFKTVIRYGALGGAIVMLYTTILTRTGIIFHNGIGAYLGYIAIVIMPVCTYLAIREMHIRYFQRRISLKYALLTGLLVSIIAASLYSSIKWAEHTLFTDVYREYLIDQTREVLRSEGTEEELVEKRIAEIKDHYASWAPVRNTFIWYISLGALYSLASFLILKFFTKPT